MMIFRDFGGYVDILSDFIVYAIIPIGMAIHAQSQQAWILVAVLEAVYFVNCVSQFYLASILEKRNRGVKSTGR